MNDVPIDIGRKEAFYSATGIAEKARRESNYVN